MAKQKKTIGEKVAAEYPDFATEVASDSIEQLNQRLVSLAKGLSETEETKEDDAELNDARSLASELAAPYRDAKKAIQLKSKYVVSLLKEKGAA